MLDGFGSIKLLKEFLFYVEFVCGKSRITVKNGIKERQDSALVENVLFNVVQTSTSKISLNLRGHPL